MDRFRRRVAILSGKRQGAFHPEQYWREAARRARAERKVRHLAREGQSVIVFVPKWGGRSRFVRYLAEDLRIDRPVRAVRRIRGKAVEDLGPDEIAGWLAQGMVALTGRTDNAQRLVQRHGLTRVARRVAERTRVRSTLIIDHAHLLPPDLLVPLLMAGRATEGRFSVIVVSERRVSPKGALSAIPVVQMPDYAPAEGVDFMVGCFGHALPFDIHNRVGWMGGVPELLEEYGGIGPNQMRPGALVESLPAVAAELESVIAATGAEAVRRLLAARDWCGAQTADVPLVEAGLLVRYGDKVKVRADLFADLVEQMTTAH